MCAIKLVTEPPAKEFLSRIFFGRDEPIASDVVSVLARQAFSAGARDFHFSCWTQGLSLDSEEDWFLTEEELERAFSGWPLPDLTSLPNTPRAESILVHLCHYVGVYKSGVPHAVHGQRPSWLQQDPCTRNPYCLELGGWNF